MALADNAFLPGRGGSLQREMLAGARRQGAVATRLPPELSALLRELPLRSGTDKHARLSMHTFEHSWAHAGH